MIVAEISIVVLAVLGVGLTGQYLEQFGRKLLGAMPGRIEPVRSRTAPNASNSGSIDSITEKTLS